MKIFSLIRGFTNPTNHNDISREDLMQREIDTIFSLLAYAIVYEDWQHQDAKTRGHNIGAILVNSENQVVNWARNSVFQSNDYTQHSEVQVITSYLRKANLSNLQGYTLYVTLEPCAMCSGMMIFTSTERVVYGQSDQLYGKALERLQFDSENMGGFTPYPTTLISDPSPCKTRTLLEESYRNSENRYITNWLSSEDARNIYKNATAEFTAFSPECAENEGILKNAQQYYYSITSAK